MCEGYPWAKTKTKWNWKTVEYVIYLYSKQRDTQIQYAEQSKIIKKRTMKNHGLTQFLLFV